MNGACLFLGILFLAAGIYFYSGKAVNRHKRYHFFTQRSMVRVS